MNKSEDVSKLFSMFGEKNTDQYQEIYEAEQNQATRERWPIFQRVQIDADRPGSHAVHSTPTAPAASNPKPEVKPAAAATTPATPFASRPVPATAPVQPAVQPVVTPVAEPAVQPVMTPVAEPAVQPVAPPVAEPAVQPVVTPVAEPALQAVTQAPVQTAPETSPPAVPAAPARTGFLRFPGNTPAANVVSATQTPEPPAPEPVLTGKLCTLFKRLEGHQEEVTAVAEAPAPEPVAAPAQNSIRSLFSRLSR